MFCDPHTPPYHALSMPLGEEPSTNRATSAATMRVRMTANRYGSGIRRSTYLTHSAVRDCMRPRRLGWCSSPDGFGCSVSAFGAPLVAVASPPVASGSSLMALGSSLVVIDLPSPFWCRRRPTIHIRETTTAPMVGHRALVESVGPEPERLSGRADVASGRIEHQHHHVDHTVASQTVCAVHPRHQKLIGGGHDTEAKQECIASVQRCARRQEVGDQLGESAKPRPSLLAGNGSAAEDLPRLDARLTGIFLVCTRDRVDHRAGTLRSAIRLVDRGGAAGNLFVDQP